MNYLDLCGEKDIDWNIKHLLSFLGCGAYSCYHY